MKINYYFKGNDWTKEFTNVPMIFLPNYHGGYYTDYYFSSKYSGLVFNLEGEMVKVLEQITHNLGDPREINYKFAYAGQQYDNNESKFCFYNGDCFAFEFSDSHEFFLDFDIRKIEDLDDMGRQYLITEKDKRLIIKYEKVKDNNKDYQYWIVLTPIEAELSPIEEWYEKDYAFDRNRSSFPDKRYVRRSVRVNGKGFVLNVATDLATALKRAKEIDKVKKLSSKNRRSVDKAIIPFNHEECRKSSILALNSFLSLNFHNTLIAGLPWFYQRWSRDELISLPGLLYLSRPDDYKRILIDYVVQLEDDKLPIHLGAEGSFDGVGWLFKRINDYSKLIQNLGGKPFAQGENELIIEKLSELVACLNNVEGFIMTKYNESWMDTKFNNYKREGAVLEHQVMVLVIYELLHSITKEAYLNDYLNQWKEKIIKNFFNEGYIDTLDDDAIRPSIFLAWYIYPKLFKKHDWEKYFDYAIEHLWLDWGGFSTINKDHPSFNPYYSGSNDASYHRGDSWYWINNIAALAMRKTNPTKYRDYYEKILEASTKDLEEKAFIGFTSELSSAMEPRAEGCLNQLWSSSTYLELLDKLFITRK